MHEDKLKQLPVEVKTLVNDGVYSLYSVKNRPGIAYVLLTNARKLFPLTGSGEIVQAVTIGTLSELELGDAIYFEGLKSGPALQLNYT
ncbi:hypothetical protein [Stigmatella erecta]|uniref:Uncharacterized protein n=1 Tax=Stigmatella erecta TaxID=83460 RepID=A0A1I0L0E8_9BACT|nr:hypothetical protein [Stigmatella erecta]SEU32224.1 hypothetical protein SAMN05443639_116166 [Stigmatella erecta]